MRKLFLIAAAVTLAACKTTDPGVSINTGYAPLAQTQVDNKGIVLALESAATINALVVIARDAGYIKKGTQKGQMVAGYLRDLAAALRTASAAQRAGDTGKVDLELLKAAQASRLIREILHVPLDDPK